MTDNIKEKHKLNLDAIVSYYHIIAIAIALLQFIAIIKPINFWYTLILFSINIFLFLYVKEKLEKSKKNIGFVIFILSFILLIFNVLALIGNSLNNVLRTNKSIKPLLFMLGIGITIGLLAIFTDEEKRSYLKKIYDTPFFEQINNKEKKKSTKKGDAVLCINAETKKPVVIPYEDRFLHMLVLGPTGSGKTSQVLIPLINQDVQNPEAGITVIEPKGDLAEKVFAMAKYYGREAVYFNPVLPDCPYFNPLYGPEDEVIENMATTFKMLSPESSPFFSNMNEQLIRNALKVIKRLKGNNATLIDLSTLIYNSQGQGKIMVNQFARLKTDTVEMAKENGEIASWFLSDYFNERSKTYEHCSGLRSQITKITSNVHLRRVLNPPNGENDVNFGKLIEEGKILAISTAQGELRDLNRFLGYFIILNFQSAVFKRPGNENTRRPHFLYIDEFQVYSNPGFADMLTQGRSYRVASHLATQNRALMAMGGSRDGKNFVELVSTNARNIVIFPGGNSNDAKYYSDEFGEITKIEKRKSVSKAKFNPLYGFQKMRYPNESVSEVEKTEARFSHSDIIYKKFGQIVYRIIQNKTVQPPGVGLVSWIPKELNSELDRMVEEYKKNQEEKIRKLEEEKEGAKEINEPLVDAVITFEDEVKDEKPANTINKPINNKNPNIVVTVNDSENEIINDNKKEPQKEKEQHNIVVDLDDEALDDLI